MVPVPAASAPPLVHAREDLSLAQARRIALRAQGLDRARRDVAPTMRHLQQVVDRVGLLQIDSVNVLARAHLMPAYSRIGPYDLALLDRASGRAPRRLVEAWAHEASLVPPTTFRLLGWRQRAFLEHAWGSIREVPVRHPGVLAEIRDLIAERGPLTAREVHEGFAAEHPRVPSGWGWNWSVAKRVLEFLFFTGEVTAARRNSAFERCYDLTTRVLPREVLAAPRPDDDAAVRALIEIGARAHGIGTTACFADYFRVRGPRVAQATSDLVDDGVLHPVVVRGWARPTYLHRDASLPRAVSGRALLSPFDPLVFERRRLEELFGTRYRIEIYTPAHKRVHGYYVLPFLLGDRIAALVDLKADRQAGVLRVQAAHHEPNGHPAAPGMVAADLAAELSLMARWLGLGRVSLSDEAHGDLVTAVRDAVAGAGGGGHLG